MHRVISKSVVIWSKLKWPFWLSNVLFLAVCVVHKNILHSLTHTHTHTHESKSWEKIRQYGEKLKNNDEFNVKESRRYKVSALINPHLDSKNDDTECWYINDEC